MRLRLISEPFDHPDVVYEPKLDGFRALVHVRGHRCELVSATGTPSSSVRNSPRKIAHAVRAHCAVLDGEICCLEPTGETCAAPSVRRRASVAAALAAVGSRSLPATWGAIAPAVLAAPLNTDVNSRHARTRAVAERR